MDNKHILIVDDDEMLRQQLSRAFSRKGFAVTVATNAQDAFEVIDIYSFTHAVVDLRMAPGANGLKVIEKLSEKQPLVKSIVFTGFGSIATAIDAVKKGASNYLTKPASIDEIVGAFDGTPPEVHRIPSLDEVSGEYMNRVLTEFNGNVTKAAKALGMHRRSLQRKLGKSL